MVMFMFPNVCPGWLKCLLVASWFFVCDIATLLCEPFMIGLLSFDNVFILNTIGFVTLFSFMGFSVSTIYLFSIQLTLSHWFHSWAFQFQQFIYLGDNWRCNTVFMHGLSSYTNVFVCLLSMLF